MNAADFAVHVDDFGDAAIICPRCGFPTYTPIENDVTIGILIKLAQEHIAAHAMSEHRDMYPSWTSSGSSTSATQTRTHTQTNS